MNTNKESDTLRAHVFSTHNRNALAKDKLCGCFDCIKVFSPSEIEEYTEEDTALCPYYGNDSVIGESSGFPITEDFMLRMHRKWMASGCGIQIKTPFGKILFFLDGVPVSFEYRSIDPDEALFPNVAAAYRIQVCVEPDGKAHLLKMQLSEGAVTGDTEPGERLEAISFYSERGKITLGCYASFGDYLDYNLDYDGSLCHDGIEVDIFSSTKTQVYKFGVCWLDVCTEENEAQTWFGADPGICGF